MTAITTAAGAAATGTFHVLPIDQVDESPLNTRRHFDPKSIDELAASIRSHGVLTPILVRPNGKRFEIAAGARRIRAARKAKLTEIPAVVQAMDDVKFLEIITIENLQREDVHPLDEALGYKALIDRAGYDPQQIADRIGKSLSYVYTRMKLAELIPAAQKLFSSERITASHAILIARLQPTDQKRALDHGLFFQRYVHAEDLGGGDQVKGVVSVRELETWVRLNVLLDLHAAPWRKDDATLLPTAGPCTTCPKRVGNQPQLFPEVTRGDICSDPGCFAAKMTAFFDRTVSELAAVTKRPVLRLSNDYGHRQKKPGVLYSGQWSSAANQKCKHTAKGVFVDVTRGYDRGGYHLGQVIDVCAERSCKVPHGHQVSARSSAAMDGADRRRKREEQLRQQIRGATLDAVIEKAPPRLDVPLLRIVAEAFLNDIWYEYRKAIARRHHSEPEKSKSQRQRTGADWEKVLNELIRRSSEPELQRLLLEMSLIKDAYGGSAYRRGDGDKLSAVARALKVNTSAIARRFRAEAAAKAKRAATMNGSKVRSKKSQTSARKARAR